VRGPGETQLEIDQRLIQQRMVKLREELEKVKQQRAQQRRQRRRAEVPTVAIVGYTNAGKSTLLNSIAKADVLAEDKLFATLDPTTRRVRLPRGHECIFTDTVGFIQKLPTQLVAAFRATLEETLEADALLHVVDATHADVQEQANTVNALLGELGAGDKPMIFALNKADRLKRDADGEFIPPQSLNGALSEGVFISAQKRMGLENLMSEIEAALFERLTEINVRLPFSAGDLLALLRRQGVIEVEKLEEQGTLITARVPGRLIDTYRAYMVK